MAIEGGPVPKTKPKCKGCDKPVCNVCNLCHTETCVFERKTVIDVQTLTEFKKHTARTQKALGVAILNNIGLQVPKPWGLIQSEEDIDPVWTEVSSKHNDSKEIFVRPCPTRPRHGFVESRSVDRSRPQEDLRETLKAAREADEQGYAELMIMPRIEASANVVITPTMASVGPGHDGATSGHGCLTVPLMGSAFMELTKDILAKARIGSEEDPYIEAVLSPFYNEVNTTFTQLRAGAKIPIKIGQDFIPEIMRVERVLMASGDLLEWERQTKEIKPGTVVCHAGGSLISHYGVHCLTSRVPIMTSRVPIIGEVLEPQGAREDYDLEAMIQGIGVGASVMMAPDVNNNETNITSALGLKLTFLALHNAGVMTGEHAFWLGVAVSMMMRCGMAASHGEARHKLGMKIPRNLVYDHAFDDFFLSRDTLGVALWKFQNLSWSSAYGGKKWADCTEALVDLDNKVRAVLNDPTQENAQNLIVSLNVAVNKAHNGGWWMDKFVSKNVFDLAAHQAVKQIPEALYGMMKVKQLQNLETAQEIIDLWKVANGIQAQQGKLLIEFNKKYENLSEDEEPGGDDDEEPSEFIDVTQVSSYTNINKYYKPTGLETVEKAQCLVINGTAHVQYKLDVSPGYLSTDMHCDVQYFQELAEAVKDLPKIKTLSGSGNDLYVPMSVEKNPTGTYWVLKILNVDEKLGKFTFYSGAQVLVNTYNTSTMCQAAAVPSHGAIVTAHDVPIVSYDFIKKLKAINKELANAEKAQKDQDDIPF